MSDIRCDIRYGDGRGALVSDTGNATVTLSHGVRPSTFTFESGLQAEFIPRVSDVAILQNGRAVVTFHDCAIDGIVRSNPGSGASTFTVRVLDRRWKWWKGGGVVSGSYNLRRPDKKILEGTEKSPRELCQILLEALGESRFSVDGVPDRVPPEGLPEIVWDHISPAIALQELVSKIGCRVVLGADDRISIVRVGTGPGLPREPLIDDSEVIESVAIPDRLLFITEKTQWQGLLLLEPVGLDLDNEIKPWVDLSYRPENGFEAYAPEYPGHAVTYGADDEEQDRARKLAALSVWRWFRVLGQPSGELGPVPEFRGGIEHRWQYALLNQLNDTAENRDGSFTRLEPYILGQWYDRNLGLRGDESTPPGCVPLNTRYPDQFVIDAPNQLVKTARPVYVVDRDGNYQPPKLYLYCAYHLKDAQTRIAVRVTRSRRLAARENGTGEMPVRIDDLYRVLRINHEHSIRNGESRYTQSDVETNDEEVDRIVEYYNEAKVAELQPGGGSDRPYGGFIPISPGGKIQQVTWSLVGGVGMTRASENSEHNVQVPRYDQRMRIVEQDFLKEQLQELKRRPQ